MSTALTRESLIEVPRWVTAFNFPIIGCSDSPPDHHCPPPFVLFVYFPSHPFSRSLLLPSFFLSLLILVQSRPLSPIFFPSHWYSPTDIRLFSNCHLYFLIFPVSRLSSFLSRLPYCLPFTCSFTFPVFSMLHSSSLPLSSCSFCFLFLLLPLPPVLHVFVFFTPLSLFVSCSTRSISSRTPVPFCSYFISFPSSSFSTLPVFFPLLSSFPPHATSFSATAEPPSS